MPSVPPNMLQDIHARMNNLAIYFRDRVCEECSWSVPTFYRKMRNSHKGSDKTVPILSNAEIDKIIAVFDEVIYAFIGYCDRHRRKKA